MKELLEARALLARMRDHLMELSAKLPMQYFGLVDSGIIQDSNNLIARIEAAPEPNAMEIVRQVREGSVAGHTLSSNYWKLPDPEAAALIADQGKRVPRAMLEEVYRLGYSSAVEEGKWKISYDTIAEKFHVAIEDVE